jgi:hypothetical protein
VSHNDLNTIERRVAILRELRRNALESIAFVERLMAASQWTVGTPAETEEWRLTMRLSLESAAREARSEVTQVTDMSDDLNDDLLAG